MLNWVNVTYNELQDMSLTVTQLLATIVSAITGLFAMVAIGYGITKLITRNK